MTFAKTWQSLKSAVDLWVSQPFEKPINGMVESVEGADCIPSGNTFVPEESYFGVRLVEMSLAEGGKYFADFLPLAVCLAEYTRGTERQRTPLILSNDIIGDELKKAGAAPGRVEFRNMYAVRCMPVKADNLSLFVGLFRMPYNDLAKQLLQIASDITDQVGAVPMSQGLRVAEKVYDRIAGLFNLNVVTPLLGFADGNAAVKSGYLVVAGPRSKELNLKKFSVINERLHVLGAEGSQPASGFDYCLLAIEHTATLFPLGPKSINTVTSLGLHKKWQAITQLLANQDEAKADAEMRQLRSEIVTSSELTEEDRLIAVAAYETSYGKFREVLIKPVASGSTDAPTRGAALAKGLTLEAEKTERPDIKLVLEAMADRLKLKAQSSFQSEEAQDEFVMNEARLLRQRLKSGKGGMPGASEVAEAISVAVHGG